MVLAAAGAAAVPLRAALLDGGGLPLLTLLIAGGTDVSPPPFPTHSNSKDPSTPRGFKDSLKP